ncbi:hypothetical protein L53_00115 [Hyphomonas sp. L-53-1-40]|uniref:hypothetical protein n=1 Tax=Hyphomonas sp. L-53-1-40 TaxID=1207058 RepID=UPI0004589F71|nr:hypothetical protein [Hyphomonas sp. L-53-1-40]KCZ65745.1 hypothetical protein L53_00115 [Hyphomonas sp. L-53-1-40]
MSEAQFYTFFTGGLGLLIAAALMIAWQLWRLRDEERDGAISALDGISHEMRINLQRMANEVAQIVDTQEAGPDVLLPVQHPQLDGVNASLIKTNRNAIAVIGATYQELEARKMALRAVLAQKRDLSATLDDAMDATINGIATLYMWEEHAGVRPSEAGTVRSWHVRDWMKAHGFSANSFPGMHLRDEVVERLRQYGLHLTPRPLTHTAHEYYSMQYDRKADPHAPFWKRKPKTEEVMAVAAADEAAEYIDEDFEDTHEGEADITPSENVDAALAEIEAMDDDLPEDDEAYAEEDSDEAGRLPN